MAFPLWICCAEPSKHTNVKKDQLLEIFGDCLLFLIPENVSSDLKFSKQIVGTTFHYDPNQAN